LNWLFGTLETTFSEVSRQQRYDTRRARNRGHVFHHHGNLG